MVNIRHIVLVSLITILFSACGNNIYNEENCLPPVDLVSTKSVELFLVEVEESNNNYSSLKLDTDERFVCVSVPNMISCDIENLEGVKFIKQPEGSVLHLTGKAKKIVPYGLNKSFNSTITYLEGSINHTKVWMASFYLLSIFDFRSEAELNMKSLDLIGINDSSSIDINCN